MQLETDRLLLLPLTAAQMRLWVADTPALEQKLNCRYQAEPLSGFFLDIVKGQAAKTTQDPENHLFHTFWFLLRKKDRVVVGLADFKDTPTAQGEVEIGYGLGREFENKGYMTEAVQALCHWVLQQPRVSHVIAETDIDSPASQAILKRCGFSLYKQAETFWWRL